MAAGARIGTEFAGYRIEALVGRGGQSVVYRAEYPRLGIPVALKLLNEDAAEDDVFRERFVRESRLAAAIAHPHIVTIYDAGVWEDTLYIALRFIPGGDLRRRLREGPLDGDRTLAIVAQAASGLDAAHAAGLVHRDVKPANIMVEAGPAAGASDIAYVTDFGLLKQVHSGQPTRSSDFLGTIDYVAPEQIEGDAVDARTDVYSLGCVVFECLTGQPPFRRENDAAVLWAHMQEEPPTVTSLRPDLPSTLDAAVASALAKRPDARPESCGALAVALREALAGRATGPRRGRRSGSDRSRPRRALATVGGVVAGALLGAAGATVALLVVDGEPSRGAEPAGTATVSVTRATTVVRRTDDRSAFLLGLVPDGFRRTCRHVAATAPDFWDTYACRPRGGAEIVRYSYARSGVLMNAFFQRRYVRAGIPPPPTGQRLPFVPSCAAPAPVALEEWSFSGAAGHQLVGRSNFGNTDGRVLCVRAPAGAMSRIEWTTAIAGVYGYAQGRNYSALLNWWLESAGPLR